MVVKDKTTTEVMVTELREASVTVVVLYSVAVEMACVAVGLANASPSAIVKQYELAAALDVKHESPL